MATISLTFRAVPGRKCKPYKIPSLKCIADVPPLPKLDNMPMHSIAKERMLTLEGFPVVENNRSTNLFVESCLI